MKFTVDYSEKKENALNIESAKHLTDYRIEIIFTDGLKKTVNFLPFLEKSSHPEIKKYLDSRLFKRFQIVEGNLSWNDFDLIFPISSLRSGNL